MSVIMMQIYRLKFVLQWISYLIYTCLIAYYKKRCDNTQRPQRKKSSLLIPSYHYLIDAIGSKAYQISLCLIIVKSPLTPMSEKIKEDT
jgi:hypothetical protein